MDTDTDLLEKLESRRATIAVIGLGYTGLPLAVAFADVGFSVVGIDVDEARVDTVNRGVSHIRDVGSEDLAPLVSAAAEARTSRTPGSGALSATADYAALDHADVAIICVPTPLSKIKGPDLSHIISASDEIARRLRRGMLIVLESTTYPGTTEEVILPRLQRANGRTLEVGTDFFLAFSPERIDPGREDWTIRNTPKVIGGVTPRCLEMATSLYESAIDPVVPVSSPKVAEMAKLLENTFRATNIALVNEISIMCDRLEVDVWEVIEAAKTKPFGFMPFYPGLGLGGHCIPVDPQYLAWKLKTLDYDARFIQLAAEINLGMPRYVLGKIADALNDTGRPLKGSRVLLLGVAYKADVSDTRESPALDLIQLLIEKGADVAFHDPYVAQVEVERLSLQGVKLDESALRGADCVVVATAHAAYDWQWVVDNARLVIDTRNVTRGLEQRSGEEATSHR